MDFNHSVKSATVQPALNGMPKIQKLRGKKTGNGMLKILEGSLPEIDGGRMEFHRRM
jgi:hypothetical protein